MRNILIRPAIPVVMCKPRARNIFRYSLPIRWIFQNVILKLHILHASGEIMSMIGVRTILQVAQPVTGENSLCLYRLLITLLLIIITFAMMVCIKSLPGMWADACGIRSIISGDTIRTRSMVD